jgi:hypothetical protein
VRRSQFLVALTSIIGARRGSTVNARFRYCQHDTGHAIGALRLSAAMLGWHLRLLPEWSDAQMAALRGLDREEDFGEAEREEAECIAVVVAAGIRESGFGIRSEVLVEAARSGSWSGRANRLSPGIVDWPIIDEVAVATRYPGHSGELLNPEPPNPEPPNPEPRTPNPEPPNLRPRERSFCNGEARSPSTRAVC